MKSLLILMTIILSISNIFSQDLSAYKKEIFSKGKYRMPYRILYPEGYNADKAYPLILVLHGSGERGNDNELQLTHGADMFLGDTVRKKFPAIVVFPQCPENSYWSNVNKKEVDGVFGFAFSKGEKPTSAMVTLQKLVKYLKGTYKLDAKRMYVGGLSMGGMGTFELVYRNPKTYAAAFPICGGAHPDTAPKLTGPNWWIFHGDADGVVNYMHSQKMFEALKKSGAEAKFSLYPDVTHNSWDNAFAEPELLPWLFTNTRK
ncbi:MAG: dienelactone hydrolase family protein [Saonia sp.]